MIVVSRVTQAIAVAAELGAAERFTEGPQTSHELARETSAHGASLYRLLRALASVGILSAAGLRRPRIVPAAHEVSVLEGVHAG